MLITCWAPFVQLWHHIFSLITTKVPLFMVVLQLCPRWLIIRQWLLPQWLSLWCGVSYPTFTLLPWKDANKQNNTTPHSFMVIHAARNGDKAQLGCKSIKVAPILLRWSQANIDWMALFCWFTCYLLPMVWKVVADWIQLIILQTTNSPKPPIIQLKQPPSHLTKAPWPGPVCKHHCSASWSCCNSQLPCLSLA